MQSWSVKTAIALILLSLLSPGVVAQNKSIYTNKKNLVTFEPPKGDKPQQTTGGASRGEQCPLNARDLELPITPLLPSASKALTVKSHPTLMVYLPETSATTALFSVRDEAEDYDYQTVLPISDRAGIVSLTLPDNAPALNVDREYQWSLILMCDGKLRPDSPVAQGYVTRVKEDGNLTQKLSQNNSLEEAIVYGKAGLWYDTVASLAELKIAQPENNTIAYNWENLLQQVGLEKVAKAEFVE